MSVVINGETGVNLIQDGILTNDDLPSEISAGKITGTLDNATIPLDNEYLMMGPTASTTYTAGARISGMRTIESNGSISQTSGLVSIGRAGTYLVIVAILCNTGTEGSNGDGRIRYSTNNVDWYDKAAFYAHAADTANWEKSVGTAVIPCALNSYIDLKFQSANHIWGNGSGYTHSPCVIVRIGD